MKHITTYLAPTILLLILLLGSMIILFFTGNPSPQNQLIIPVVLKTIDTNMEFWQVVKNGMQVAAAENGVSLEITGPWLESDIEGQIEITKNIISGHPRVLILSATDLNKLVPLVQQAKDLDIPVVTLDSGVNSDIPVTFVATNNIEAAQKLTQYAISQISPGKPVAIINHVPGATTAIEREQGVRKILEAEGKNPILGTWFTNNFQEKAYSITMDLINTHPDITAILAMNEVSVIGAAQAIEETGMTGKVKLFGFDNSLQEVKYLERGVVQATVIQKPFNMGYLAVKAAIDAVHKKKLPKFIDTGSVLIIPDNMYLPENQKLLFPFIE
ncbi:substrate-binding domain-containing protein [Gracilinema caldarium]|uniref:Periplasmic binding protein/LacI transcriptional regulator n=1 Tax=Gracilinema caldarium (strain ATCC 51460 / DSM 7334 / H1) TaxID=744872 RepID=F8F0Y5_GRAC1|nr:substrate-binding domain-containing protein [Gracilinema caldarium]AEJ20271.1 periplasmic binding protein/LacI transcriptional regulator [Gracilinema caldarium DSM 7334]